MFNKLKSVLKNGRSNKSKGIIWQDGIRPGCALNGFAGCLPPQSYDNSFSNITRIAESFAEVMPYAIDSKGKKLAKQPKLINALYNPNAEMSGPDFFETLITLMLVHPIVYILCWHYEGKELKSGGPITRDNIAGFTFLQGLSVSRVGGVTTYMDGTHTWTTDDVIALSLNVNPYQIGAGYSPTQAIKKWATVDDYIAEYQAGTFRNGAIPAGEMIITAPTVEAYNETVDQLQAHHRGAQNANNIIYSHRPTSSIDGKPMTAGVEWVPFAQSNKDMTLDAIFDQANKKIDMAFGVPEEVKGYLQNSNYASAEVADYVFSLRVVRPKLTKVWSKFTHEMSRITHGNLGFSISFDYEVPVLTDSRKVQAETLNLMLERGFTIESAVEALQLPRSFLKLASSATDAEENPQAVEDNREKPSQIADMNTYSGKSLKSKAPGTWYTGASSDLISLLKYYDTLILMYMADMADADQNNIEVGAIRDESLAVVRDDKTLSDLRTLIIAELYYRLAIEGQDKALRLFDEFNPSSIPSILDLDKRERINLALQTAIGAVSLKLSVGEVPTGFLNSEIEVWVAEMSALLTKYGLTKIIPDADGASDYPEQLRNLLVLFGEQTVEESIKSLNKILSETENQISLKDSILLFINNYNYREERWATSEQHRAEELGDLLAAEEVGELLELVPMKTWHINPASPDVCIDCIGMDGQTVRADEPFSNGDMVPHYHPHCYCTMTIYFVEKAKSVKICCPKCGRYMMESEGGVMKNVICANSKCKRHYDIEVKDGKIKAVEVAK